MGKNTNLIISARQPVLQDDGTFQPSWFRFLEALAQQVGTQQFSTADVFVDENTNDSDTSEVTQRVHDALLLGWLAE